MDQNDLWFNPEVMVDMVFINGPNIMSKIN